MARRARVHVPEVPKGYDTALVCAAGHVINSTRGLRPESDAKFCSKCGEQAVGACPSCSTTVRGEYLEAMVTAEWIPPAYCHECGKPYPWTESALSAASELADSLEGLSADEVATLKEKLPALLGDTPSTPVASHKVKTILEKVPESGKNVFEKVLSGVLTTAVKTAIFGSPAG